MAMRSRSCGSFTLLITRECQDSNYSSTPYFSIPVTELSHYSTCPVKAASSSSSSTSCSTPLTCKSIWFFLSKSIWIWIHLNDNWIYARKQIWHCKNQAFYIKQIQQNTRIPGKFSNLSCLSLYARSLPACNDDLISSDPSWQFDDRIKCLRLKSA